MLTSARRMTEAHLAVGLTRLDHRLGTREGHARPWKRTRLCSSIDIGRLLVPSQRSGDPAGTHDLGQRHFFERPARARVVIPPYVLGCRKVVDATAALHPVLPGQTCSRSFSVNAA